MQVFSNCSCMYLFFYYTFYVKISFQGAISYNLWSTDEFPRVHPMLSTFLFGNLQHGKKFFLNLDRLKMFSTSEMIFLFFLLRFVKLANIRRHFLSEFKQINYHSKRRMSFYEVSKSIYLVLSAYFIIWRPETRASFSRPDTPIVLFLCHIPGFWMWVSRKKRYWQICMKNAVTIYDLQKKDEFRYAA